jgi:penicillin-binding protein A
MIKSLNRLTLAILLGFAAVMLSLTYWSVIASDGLLGQNFNPRRVEAEQAIWRGALYDRSGEVLAQTVQTGVAPSGKPVVRRDYPRPEAVGVVGYYSLVHGVGGAEVAFDPILRGDDLHDPGQAALENMLHHAQVGSDVRLTIDARLQSALVDALKSRHGAVIAVDVPSGAVLAMVSAPMFDPNKLTASYDVLLNDPSAPLLNRATQGIYQPGGALQTVILASMITERMPLDTPITGAAQPVHVNNLTLTCAAEGAPSGVNTIADSYALACPAVFADAVIGQPGAAAVQKMFGTFGLLQAPKLARFETVSGSPTTALTEITDQERLRAQGVGQGELTVTPLQMVLVASTIANHGNVITPYLADAVRRPGSTRWEALDAPNQQAAVITQETADTIRTAMRAAVTKGAARTADRQGLTIYGHASIAYTGPNQNAQAWFIGFIDKPDGHSIAVAVVIEDTNDASAAATIGGLALEQAAR